MIALGNDNNITLYVGSDAVLKAYLGDELVYPNTQPTPSYDTQYLTFEAIDNGTTFQFNQNGLEYSVNNGTTWNSLGASTDTPSLNTGDKIMFKGNMPIIQAYGIGQFSSNGHFNIEGNPLSLVDDTNFAGITSLTGKNQVFFQLFYGTNVVDASNLALPATTLSEDCYTEMFSGCTSLRTAPELPAETLASYCYRSMFYNCTSLTTAPVLPANTLASGCYAFMFYGCTSLTTPPELPATILAQGCYSNMFVLCINLTTAPELPATTLASGCYYAMFDSCARLTIAPELPATTLATNCYQNMFRGCTSLTTAPVLPATTLVSQCYSNMFQGCTNLNYLKAMFTTTPAYNYTSNWVDGVAASGTFVKNSAAQWNVTGTNGIPSGWTVQTASE